MMLNMKHDRTADEARGRGSAGARQASGGGGHKTKPGKGKHKKSKKAKGKTFQVCERSRCRACDASTHGSGSSLIYMLG